MQLKIAVKAIQNITETISW